MNILFLDYQQILIKFMYGIKVLKENQRENKLYLFTSCLKVKEGNNHLTYNCLSNSSMS